MFFDLKIWDQFLNRGYQRRVLMRDAVVLAPAGRQAVAGADQPTSRSQTGWQERLVDVDPRPLRAAPGTGATAARRCSTGSRRARATGLDEVNLALIEVGARHARDHHRAGRHRRRRPESGHRAADRAGAARSAGTSYLSGTGGAAYLGEDAAEALRRRRASSCAWSRPRGATTGDSIVTRADGPRRPDGYRPAATA